MSLEPGTKLGAYEIVNPIGAGGMGEVYRARDTKLGRDVALKVLPEDLAQDKDRLARFEREAKLLAQLNHPNVATLHGFEDGYLVMELVEGETLAERIARGPIALDEAQPLFLQMAEGLEAAHEKGIVHRDLKPANVKITPEGKVKILDFGLARLAAGDSDATAAGDSHSPTLTKGTALGAILGTAAYMSPEQARGKVVDKRTDVWAFGCCLFEALTGKKAFTGETVSDVIGAVLRDHPDWEALPLRVRRLVQRCLEKDPRSRMRDIGDVRIQLSENTPAAAAETVSNARGRTGLVYALAGLVAGLLLAAALFSARERDVAAVPSVRRATIQLPPGQTQPRALYEPLALSPDGSELIYVAEDEIGTNLFLRRMDSYEVRKLPGTSYAMEPFFSPDGRSIGFFAARELRILALDQGSPVTLAQVQRGIGGSWGPDGTIVYGDENAGLFQVPAAGGPPERLTEPDFGKAGYSHVWPSHLPGGKVLFTIWGGESEGSAVLDFTTRKWDPALEGGQGATVLPTGYVLFSDLRRSLSLLGAPIDDRFRPTRAATAVLEGAQYDRFAGRHFAAVSSTGTLVYAPSTDGRALLEWLDRSGTLTPIRGHQPGLASPRLSPAGDRVVFLGRQSDIWILDLRRGSVDLLVPKTLAYLNWNPIWTPDGRSITFSSNRDERSWNLYEVTPGGEPRELLVKDYDQGAEAWSPDGRSLVFTEGHPKTGMDLWILPRGGKPRVLLATPANEFAATISPDGRWMAYVSDQSGTYQVYVRGFPDGKSVAVSTEGGDEPRWSADGTELYFRKGNGLYAVSISTKAGLQVSDARLILSQPFDRNTYRDRAAYDVAPDGRFLVVTNTWNTELRVIFDWFDELKRLVPTDK